MSGDSSISINTFGATVEGITDIAQCWYIILNTIPGSDPLRPNFGSYIFDYADKLTNSYGGDFAAQIIRDLEKWEPRCSVQQVKSVAGDNNNVKVTITGIYKETNAKIEATLSLDNLGTTDNTTKQRSYSDDYNEKQYS